MFGKGEKLGKGTKIWKQFRIIVTDLRNGRVRTEEKLPEFV